MKKALFILTLVMFLIAAETNAQRNQSVKRDSIVYNNSNHSYYYRGEKLSYRYLSERLKTDPQAFARMKQANNLRTFAALFAMGGGFCVGYNVYSLIKNGEPSYKVLAAGVGLFIFTIPLSGGAHIKSAQAVEIYNNNLRHDPDRIAKLEFTTGINGMGLRLRF